MGGTPECRGPAFIGQSFRIEPLRRSTDVHFVAGGTICDQNVFWISRKLHLPSKSMSDKAEEYLIRADYCRNMAEEAKTEDVKAGWLNLCEKLLGMAAQFGEPQSAELLTMLDRAGIRRRG